MCLITCPAEPNGSSCPRYAPLRSLQIGVSGEPAEAPRPCHPHPRAIVLESAAFQDLAPSCIQLGTQHHASSPAEPYVFRKVRLHASSGLALSKAGGRLVLRLLLLIL